MQRNVRSTARGFSQGDQVLPGAAATGRHVAVFTSCGQDVTEFQVLAGARCALLISFKGGVALLCSSIPRNHDRWCHFFLFRAVLDCHGVQEVIVVFVFPLKHEIAELPSICR